jgi:membrane fusion protein, multidrug efflux system
MWSAGFSRVSILLVLLGAVALIGGGIVIFKGMTTDVAAAPKTAEPFVEFASSDLATVASAELRTSIPLSGAMQPSNWTAVKAKVGGEVKQVMVREGEPVKQGQVLARIEATELQARLDEKTSNLEGAKAQLALAEKTRANNLALVKQNFISQNAFDNSQSGYVVAHANVKSLEAQIIAARKALDDAVVRAPMSGIVSERNVQPGEKVPVDGKLFTLMDLGEMELEAAVPASEIPSVKLGQAVAFRVEGFGERQFEGKIDRINPATQAGSRSISVFVKIDNRDQTLKGGMFATGNLTVTRFTAAAALPVAAVHEENGQTAVFQVAGNKLVKQPIKLGRKSDDDGLVEVVQGLKPGDRVVRANLGALRPGQSVRIGP